MSDSSWLTHISSLIFDKSKNEDLVAFPNLPLTGSLASIILVNLAYVSFVFRIGPALMKNRKPFELKKVLLVYNAFQVLASFALTITGIYYLFFSGLLNFSCVLKLPADHPSKKFEVALIYCAYLTKYLDFLDTIFFVLRKSYRQVTFLHVYHHMIMAFAFYVYTRDYGFGGHAVAAGIVNTIVHTFMYSYYFINASRPQSTSKSIWWKRYITKLQIFQFFLVLIHQAWPVFVRTDCPFPRSWLAMTTSQAVVFLILFANFYRKAYLGKSNEDIAQLNKKTKKKLIKD